MTPEGAEQFWLQAEVHLENKGKDHIAIIPLEGLALDTDGPSACAYLKDHGWGKGVWPKSFAVRLFKANRQVLSGPRYHLAERIIAKDYSDFLDLSGRPLQDEVTLGRAKRNLAQYPQ